MAKWLRCTMLPVGQGMGTFVQVFNDDTLEEASLVDFGSTQWKDQAGASSVKWVVQELARMTAPRLNAIFLSHSDRDHTNLIGSVLDAFKNRPDRKRLSLGTVWYGGDKPDYTKYGVNPIDLLKQAGATIAQCPNGTFAWDPPLLQSKDVKFRLLIGNVSSSIDDPTASDELTGTTSFLRNVVSLVLVVEYGMPAQRIFLAGDATGLTLAWALTTINTYRLSVGPVLGLSLPHHGSETSTYDTQGISTGDRSIEEIVDEFVEKVQPRSIVASAGERGTYRHPASKVIQNFSTYLGSQMYVDPELGSTREHLFTAHYAADELPRASTSVKDSDGDASMSSPSWPDKAYWFTGRTSKNVFTTDYDRPLPTRSVPIVFPLPVRDRTLGQSVKPPRAAGWAYEIQALGGNPELKRLIDLTFTPPKARLAIEAVQGPLGGQCFTLLPSAPLPAGRPESPPPPVRVHVAPAPPLRVPSLPLRLRQMP